MNSKSPNRIFWLLIILAITLLLLPRWVLYGMHADGVWYAAIAHNLALGYGTFWSPQLSQTIEPIFHSHPPLQFGLQALFFKGLGSSFWVERFYQVMMFILAAGLIAGIWRSIFRTQKELRQLAFLPVLFWLTNEDVYLTYTFNLLECTLSLFTLAAMYSIIRWRDQHIYLASFGVGVFTFLAFLTKGLVGLFPLAFIPLLTFTFYKNQWRIYLLASGLAVLTTSAFIFVSLLFPPAQTALSDWWELQVNGSLIGSEVSSNFNGNFRAHHLHILKRLCDRLIVQFILVGIWLIFTYRKKRSILFVDTGKWLLFSLLAALCGTLPFTLTLKQASYYLVPVMPYYAIFFAILLARPMANWLQKINSKGRKYRFVQAVIIIGIIISVGWNISQFGETRTRQQALVSDVFIIKKVIVPRSIIGLQSQQELFDLCGFLARYAQISLDTENPLQQPYVLTDKVSDLTVDGYQPVAISLEKYQLWRRK